jgi:homoserine O-acetyltransferase
MQVSGRNRIWRRVVIDAIRDDPGWQHGDYLTQPNGLRIAAEMLSFMGSNPVRQMNEAPTLKQADEKLDRYVTNAMAKMDANDVIYAVAASQDYDPEPDLEKIKVPLLAVNSADDLINPPELRVLERDIQRVKYGEAVVIPYSDQTVGHGSHTKAVLWEKNLVKLLQASEKK